MARLCLSDPARHRKGSSLNPFSHNIRFLWPLNLSEHELKNGDRVVRCLPWGHSEAPQITSGIIGEEIGYG